MQKQHSSVSPRGNGSGSNAGSPKAPFMERMKQSLSGGGADGKSGGGQSQGSPAGSPNNVSTLPRPSTAGVLRRKDRDARSAFSFAARALTEVVDTVEQAAKKVSLGNIATAVANIARDKKATSTLSQLPGPHGVTQACSVIFQHVLSPLWAIDQKPMPVIKKQYVSLKTPDSVRMMRLMDLVGTSQTLPAGGASSITSTGPFQSARHLLESLRPVLETSLDLSTVFLIMLCARLRWVESQETLPILDVSSPRIRTKSGGGGSGNAEMDKNSTNANWASTGGPKCEQLIEGLCVEFTRLDDESHFDDRLNDESQTADHSRRRLEDIGGRQWRPKGASMLSSEAHELRHQLLSTIMYASVTLTYNYYDPLLQLVVDEICCKQLFLTSFSEGFTQLVAGVKGFKYLSKYIMFVCRDSLRGSALDGHVGGGSGGPSGSAGGAPTGAVVGGGGTAVGDGSGSGGGASGGTSSFDRSSHFFLPHVGVESVILQDVMRHVELALQNFMHRNDVGLILLTAFHRCVTLLSTDGDRTSTTAVFFRITTALQTCYFAELDELVSLVDVVKPFVAKPNPVGSAALKLLHCLFASLRDINSMQRQTLDRLFVGGPEHSFRRVPAYAVISPYCARAALIAQVYWGDVDQRRGANVNAPAVITHGRNPFTGEAYPQLDDTSVCVANHLVNVFQTLHELEHLGNPSEAAAKAGDDNSFVNLGLLFSISPTTLASLYPTVRKAVDTVQQELGMRDRAMIRPSSADMEPEVLQALHDMYLQIQDRHRPSSGAVRFRNENPRLPVVPIRVHRYFEKDDLEVTLKTMMDDYSTSCDARMGEHDVALLHPQSNLSLRMLMEATKFMKVIIGGGSGLLRRSVTASLRLQLNYPGAYVRPLFYVLPFGYGNDMAAWLARGDTVYRERIFNLFLSQVIKTVEPPMPEHWAGGLLLTPASFAAAAGAGSGAAALASSSPGAAASGSSGAPSIAGDSVTSLFTRDAINDFVTFGTQMNEVVIYQAECTFLDGSMGQCFIPFVANFEIGAHVNAAVQTAFRSGGGAVSANGVLQPNPALHSAQFSAPSNKHHTFDKSLHARSSSANLSRQNTAQSNSSGESSNNLKPVSPSSFAAAGPLGLPQTSSIFGTTTSNNNGSNRDVGVYTPAFSISIGAHVESLDRVLTRMHGLRGVPLTTKQHLVDGTELPNCVSGEHVLDWISTAYQLYDLNVARNVAQSLQDSKLLVCMSVPLGKELHRFLDVGIYSVLPREELDSQPLCPPSVRSVLCEHSNWCRMEFEDQLCNGGSASWGGSGGGGASSGGGLGGGSSESGPATVPIRVTFQSYFDGALQYNDLVDSKDYRDVVSIKVKSAGGAEDLGPLPNPCIPTLIMSALQNDGKKKGSGGTSSGKQQRDICDLMDHYQIKFGDRQAVDPRSSLQFEWKHATNNNNNNNSVASPDTLFSPSSFGAQPTDTAASFVGLGNNMSGLGGIGGGGVRNFSTAKPEALGMYCMFDGDVFGPFSLVRIKPVTVKSVGEQPPRSTFATAAVMSFVKPA